MKNLTTREQAEDFILDVMVNATASRLPHNFNIINESLLSTFLNEQVSGVSEYYLSGECSSEVFDRDINYLLDKVSID